MAAANNVGFAYGFNVHNEDNEDQELDQYGRSDTTDITEAGHLVRDVVYGSNFVASHLVHFYQLAALDFLDVANAGIASLDKSPFCPRFGPAPTDTLYPYYYRVPPNITAYLVAQYVIALTVRRMCNQIGGIWGGRAPFVQGLTPGGATPSVTQEAINKTKELLWGWPTYGRLNPGPGSILAFIGQPTDLAVWVGDTGGNPANLPIIGTGTHGGTMLFDVVAVAMFYPEYFWMGNAHERFLAYGVFEKGDLSNPIGDNRLLSRGRKKTGAKYAGTPNPLPAVQENVYECVKSSHYVYSGGNQWLRPLDGQTTPKPAKDEPDGAYSWVKSPRYKDFSDTDFNKAVPYEAGPLARMQVNGDYYGGLLYDAGYTFDIPVGPFAGLGVKVPQYGAGGPDLNYVFGSGGLGLPGPWPDLGPVSYNGDSALDRYAARQLECWKIAQAMPGWIDRLQAKLDAGGAETVTSITRTPGVDKYYSSSYGWTEAPRGALGHWMKSNSNKITKYQCVVPSTWNASPRDHNNVPGPAEKGFEGCFVRDADHPLEILRAGHSWDFCTACAVHLVQPKGRGKKKEKRFTFQAAPSAG